MTHLLDTNVCIGAMRGNPQIHQALQIRHPNDLGVSTITVFELYSVMVKVAPLLGQVAEQLSRFIPQASAAARSRIWSAYLAREL